MDLNISSFFCLILCIINEWEQPWSLKLRLLAVDLSDTQHEVLWRSWLLECLYNVAGYLVCDMAFWCEKAWNGSSSSGHTPFAHVLYSLNFYCPGAAWLHSYHCSKKKNIEKTSSRSRNCYKAILMETYISFLMVTDPESNKSQMDKHIWNIRWTSTHVTAPL